MNKLLIILVLLLTPLLLVASKTKHNLKQMPTAKTNSAVVESKSTVDCKAIAVTGPSIKSASFAIKLNTGLISTIDMSSENSLHLVGAVNLPVVMVTPMSARRDDASVLDTDGPAGFVVTEYALHQNYPNPFNPATQIVFDLVDAGEANLTVYNSLGQTVTTLVNGSMNAGRHTVAFNAAGLPSGLYFYRLSAGDFTAIRKMILMK
jgi:hypothetical protein